MSLTLNPERMKNDMTRPILTLKKPLSTNDTASAAVMPPATKSVVKKANKKSVEKKAQDKPAIKKPKPEVPPVLKLLCQKFPKSFDLKVRKPLKIGIHEDILAVFENHPDITITANGLKRALVYYTRGKDYLIRLTNCPERIDLKGETVGSVDDAAKNHAVEQLATLGRK